MTWTGSLFLLAETCCAVGDEASARTLTALLAPHAGHMVVIAAMAACPSSVDRCLAQLAAATGDRSEAASRFDRALALEERLGAAPLAARTRYWYARLLLERPARSDVELATSLLEEGLRTATELQMATLEEQIKGLLGD